MQPLSDLEKLYSFPFYKTPPFWTVFTKAKELLTSRPCARHSLWLILCFYFLIPAPLADSAPITSEIVTKDFDGRIKKVITGSTLEDKNLVLFHSPAIKACRTGDGALKKVEMGSTALETLYSAKDIKVKDKSSHFDSSSHVTMTRLPLLKVVADKKSEVFDLVTFTLESQWEAEGDRGREVIVWRYLAKSGSVKRMTTASFGEFGKAPELAQEVERELSRFYLATKIESSPDLYEGISLPSCTFSLKQGAPLFKDWVFNDVLINEKNEIKQELNGQFYWTHKGTPGWRTKSLDFVTFSYLPKRALTFIYKDNTYECFSPEKDGDFRSEQERSLIQQENLQGLIPVEEQKDVAMLYRINKDPEVGKFYQDVIESYEQTNNDEGSTKAPRRAEFSAMNPILYIADPLKRAYRCRAINLLAESQ